MRNALLISKVLVLLQMCTSAASTNTTLSEREVIRILLDRSQKWIPAVHTAMEDHDANCKMCCVNIQENTIGRTCGQHTLCKYHPTQTGPSCKGYLPIRFSVVEQETLVAEHNRIRNLVAGGLEKRARNSLGDEIIEEYGLRQPEAANMRQMEWNSELAYVAERWAAQCVYAHDLCRDIARYPVGQNIARGKLSQSNDVQLVKTWHDEAANFQPKLVTNFIMSSKLKKFTSYSQIVWADTYHVGCARAIFHKASGPNIRYVAHLICNYGPTGNIPNQPVYKIGKACSSCSEGTSCSLQYTNLCVQDHLEEDLMDYIEVSGVNNHKIIPILILFPVIIMFL